MTKSDEHTQKILDAVFDENISEILAEMENLRKRFDREKIDSIMRKYNFSIDLDIPVLNLSAGQKHVDF